MCREGNYKQMRYDIYVSRIRVKETKVAYVPNTGAKSYLDKFIPYSPQDRFAEDRKYNIPHG